MHHADDFSALIVNRHRVEVVHFNHFIRADGVTHGTGILSELVLTHHPDLLDTVTER